MGAHHSETSGQDPCHGRVAGACRGVGGAGAILPEMGPEVPNTGPAVEVEVEVPAPSSYATAGKLLFAAAGAFAAILLALIALHLYNSGRGRRAQDRRRQFRRSPAISGVGEEPSPWRGLDPAVLRALPVVAAAVGAGDCAVCLAEFEHGEQARALPRCGHRFHVQCIDAWFLENSTCPLCRADVEAPDDAVAHPGPEVRIDVAGGDDDAAKGGAPAIAREDAQRHGS